MTGVQGLGSRVCIPNPVIPAKAGIQIDDLVLLVFLDKPRSQKDADHLPGLNCG